MIVPEITGIARLSSILSGKISANVPASPNAVENKSVFTRESSKKPRRKIKLKKKQVIKAAKDPS